VVLTESEFAFGADHPVGDVTVGLARGDGEVAGERGAWWCDHDEITFGEVAGAADDAAGFGSTDVDLAPADGLFELGEFLDLEDLADHDRAVESGTDEFDRLDLEAGVDQALGDVPAGLVLGDGDEVADPGR